LGGGARGRRYRQLNRPRITLKKGKDAGTPNGRRERRIIKKKGTWGHIRRERTRIQEKVSGKKKKKNKQAPKKKEEGRHRRKHWNMREKKGQASNNFQGAEKAGLGVADAVT